MRDVAPSTFLFDSRRRKELVLLRALGGQAAGAPSRPLATLAQALRRPLGAFLLPPPFPPRRLFAFKGARCDLLIVGANPLLLALALRRALRHDAATQVVLAPVRCFDPWEYEALRLAPVRFLASMAVAKALPVGTDATARLLAAAQGRGNGAAEAWLDEVLALIATTLPGEAAGRVRWIEPADERAFDPIALRSGEESPVVVGTPGADAATLAVSRPAPTGGHRWPDQRVPLQSAAEAALRRRLLVRLPKLALARGEGAELRVLAHTLLAVSALPGGFAGTEPDGDGAIHPALPWLALTGSAACRRETKGVAMEGALADVATLLADGPIAGGTRLAPTREDWFDGLKACP